MDTLVRDLRMGFRLWARSPLLGAVVVATLGFGIGANTAIFSFVNALLLRPYPFERLDDLVHVWERHAQTGRAPDVRSAHGDRSPMAPADFLDLRRESRSFEGLAALRQRDLTLVQDGEPERIAGTAATPELFGLLRVEAERGRVFRSEEAQAGRDAVVVVSHGFWRRRLGAAPDAVGRELRFDGRPHTVVGVMPARFAYPPGGVEAWVPLVFPENEKSERGRLNLQVLGRLAPGVSVAQAGDDLARQAIRLEQEYPATNLGRSFTLVRLREQQAGFTMPFAALFQGASALALLLACANVGAILVARALARRREISLRMALGASRGRLARQLLAESMALALLGLLPAVAVAGLAVRLIRTSVPPDITKYLAGWHDIRLDERALLFGAATAILTALVTGLAPALGAGRFGLAFALRDGGHGTAGEPGRRRHVLVVSQLALALVLLVAAALMVQGFDRLARQYQGFEPEGVLTFRVRLPEGRYPPGRGVVDFYGRLLESLEAVPGVEAAALASQFPGDLGPMPSGPVSLRGRTSTTDVALPVADYQTIGSGYFRALRIPLVRGRGFDERDGSDATPVAIVSESMAERLWPGEDPLGQQLKTGRPDAATPWREVVGVVSDVTQYWFDRQPRSTVYLPYPQGPRANTFVVLRVTVRPAAATGLVRARVAALDPELPIDEVRSLAQAVEEGMALLRLAANFLLVLGLVAGVLSALGVYGLVAHDVARRTPEIGLRLALGASPAAVLRLVLRRAAAMALLSVAIGIPVAVALGRIMTAELFGVVKPEYRSLILLGAALVAISLVAAWLPARRAAAVDAMAALRAE
jgi:putative ABC transport system permease protein